MTTWTRPSGRGADALRRVTLTRNYTRHAEGSVLVEFGDTKVLCTASVEPGVPGFLRGLGQGWLTAEYGMLPRSTHTRSEREAARGKQSGRTQEIQRLIGRSMRSVIDLKAMGEMTVTLDCDVIQADGGTRTAAITGAWVALSLAFRKVVKNRVLAKSPVQGQVAAVSCGLFKGTPVLDLDYAEDSEAEADGNFVLTADGGLVEVQATAEKRPMRPEEVDALMALAKVGCAALFKAQTEALGD